MHYKELNRVVGNVDIYLLDQILKGTFEGKKRVLDAGCGEGRNLPYFINNGYDVYGIDSNPMAIKMLHMIHKAIPKDNFLQGHLEKLPWKADFFDTIICTAVLHFAKDRASFYTMLGELSRVLAPGGVLFLRMATTIGITPETNDHFTYLMTPEDVEMVQIRFRLTRTEPFKSVVVDNKRSMGTLVLEKS